MPFKHNLWAWNSGTLDYPSPKEASNVAWEAEVEGFVVKVAEGYHKL